MSGDNASISQYHTPTPVCSVSCLVPPPPTTELPHTGFDVGLVLAIGLVVIALGVAGRKRVKKWL